MRWIKVWSLSNIRSSGKSRVVARPVLWFGICGALALPGASPGSELSLRVETARVAGRTLQVTLRNTAPRIVRGFCTAFDGSGVELTELLPPRQAGILPGQTYLARSDLGPEVGAPEAAAASFFGDVRPL